jgi:hypothetical protein
MLIRVEVCSCTLKMEVACSHEMLVMIYWTTRCYVPEYSKIHVEILFVLVPTVFCQPGLDYLHYKLKLQLI